MSEIIITTEYSEEMQKSYLDYSMSVITSRAIPDARDGLKPVQRRVLYDMSELKLHFDKPHRKSARIVGDTMGKYHPHGDSSIYETLVVLSQDWKRSVPLIEGHGNFGSIEGDGAAAMRYTEAKLKKFTQEVYLKDLDKTVDFISNYDETEKEPEVLPVRVPNLLINGAEGIAVGMSTSIPPHNLKEVIDTCIYYINNNSADTKELLDILKGPDFPTGGIISNKDELLDIYETGSGKIKLRGKIEVELGRRRADKDKLIISEIPYTMVGTGINKFLQDVASLVESKKLNDVTDISNQSDKNGTRIVLELKKDADIEKIKNILYKKTKLEDTFGVNILAIANKRPETLNLRSILKYYLDFQYENNNKKYNILLNKELEKKEIQEGLIRACDVIDVIIAVLRGSKNINDAKKCLIYGDISNISFKIKEFENIAKTFDFSEIQAKAILEMRLYKLIGLEIMALLKENQETLKKIKNYEKILNSKKMMDKVIIEDLENIKKEFGMDRKTVIDNLKEAVYEEEPIEKEEVVFLMDKFAYCKIIDKNLYEKNAEFIENEYKYIIPVINFDKICIFSNLGYLHQVKVLDIPYLKVKDKGIPIDNLCKFDTSQEDILYIDCVMSMQAHNLLFVTKNAFIKKVNFEEFLTNNKKVSSCKLADDDELICVELITKPETDIVLLSDNDYLLRFSLLDISQAKKTSKGEKAMKLSKGVVLKDAYLFSKYSSIKVKNKEILINRLKVGKRNDKGSKVRA